MEAQILEGTLAEIQQQMSGLACPPEKRLRVVITESEPTESTAASAGPFRPSEFRNGVPLLSRRRAVEPVTPELVKRLLDEEDEERLLRHPPSMLKEA
jgi:hypothetical protein